MLDDAVKHNSLDKLPEEVRNKYTIKPYVRQYEITDELRQETLDYIKTRIEQFESKSNNEIDWKPVEIDKSSEFFCSVLCGYKHICKYIADYKHTKEEPIQDDDDDLF